MIDVPYQLAQIVHPSRILSDPSAQAAFQSDGLTAFAVKPLAIPSTSIGPTEPNLAGIFCPATQESNSGFVTEKTLKRMFAWDAPQYSTQNPFHTVLAVEESGVYQR